MTGPNAAFRNFTVLIAMARTAQWLMTTRVLAGITFWSSASPGLYCCGDRAARHLWDSDSRTTSGGSCRAPMLGGMPPTADIKEELTARSSRRWRGPPLLACARAAMTARSPQRDEAGFFTDPSEASQRRYEALRGVFVDGLSYAEAGRRFGYARWAMVDLARQLRAGRLWLFAPPGRPGRRPGAAPNRNAGLTWPHLEQYRWLDLAPPPDPKPYVRAFRDLDDGRRSAESGVIRSYPA